MSKKEISQSEVRVYKRSVDNKELLLVGTVDNKNSIIFNEPNKVIHQVNYEYPTLYKYRFELYEDDKLIHDCLDDLPKYQSLGDRELLVYEEDYTIYSIGYYDNGKVVYWDQFS